MEKPNMKNFIAEGLLSLCRSKQLQKITVTEVMRKCGISRGTFYYHYKDKQDVINWIYHTSYTVPFRQDILSSDLDRWAKMTEDSLVRMYNLKYFLEDAIRIEGQNDLKSFIYEELIGNWELLTQEYLRLNHTSEGSLDIWEKNISDFFAGASCTLIVNWLLDGMKMNPSDFSRLLHTASGFGFWKALDFHSGSSSKTPENEEATKIDHFIQTCAGV